MRPTPKRITLTVGQCATPEGQALIALLRSVTQDGTLDLAEVKSLRDFVTDSRPLTALPATEFLREQLDGILDDGRLDAVEIGKLFKAVLRVLPKDVREQARETRQEVERQELTAWREDPATERQLAFIRDLGGSPDATLSKGEASDLIERLLATRGADTITPRQEMVLRFWDRLDLKPQGKDTVSEWMDTWYDADVDHLLAWEEWKQWHGDNGERAQEHVTRVKIGIGREYLYRVKSMLSEQRDATPPSDAPQPTGGVGYLTGKPTPLPARDPVAPPVRPGSSSSTAAKVAFALLVLLIAITAIAVVVTS